MNLASKVALISIVAITNSGYCNNDLINNDIKGQNKYVQSENMVSSYDFNDYINTNGQFDTQKFVDENIIVETQPADRFSAISKKVIVKNNSDYFINGIPFKLVNSKRYNIELNGSMLYLFLRPHEEISYYFMGSGNAEYGLKAEPTKYLNVVSIEENNNIAYANDLTMKINNLLPYNRGFYNVTFTNKLDKGITLKSPYNNGSLFIGDIYCAYNLSEIYPGHNMVDELSPDRVAHDEDLNFAPGENKYTVNATTNESVVFMFYGQVNEDFLQNVKEFPEYSDLVNNRWNTYF